LWVKAHRKELNAYHRKKYWDNPEKSKEKNRRSNKIYYSKHSEEIKAAARSIHRENREVNIQKMKEYYQEHQEESKNRCAKWRDSHREQTRQYAKEYRRKNYDRVLFLNSKRKVRKKGLPGSYTFNEWVSLKDLYGHTCPACGRSEPEIKLTADHVIPITVPGSSDWISNIQPLCVQCNSSKECKTIRYPIPLCKQ
jgi:5-methylcytosine-specific restriction endonuclease McrA